MISGKDVRIENGNIIINGNKHPIVQDVSDIEEQINFLSFAHFVQIPFTTSILDSIKTAFETDLIPVDLYGIIFGVIKGDAGSQRVIFIAQNQSLGSAQRRCAAVYFGAYTTPRYCFKQDATEWTDIALS